MSSYRWTCKNIVVKEEKINGGGGGDIPYYNIMYYTCCSRLLVLWSNNHPAAVAGVCNAAADWSDRTRRAAGRRIVGPVTDGPRERARDTMCACGADHPPSTLANPTTTPARPSVAACASVTAYGSCACARHHQRESECVRVKRVRMCMCVNKCAERNNNNNNLYFNEKINIKKQNKINESF